MSHLTAGADRVVGTRSSARGVRQRAAWALAAACRHYPLYRGQARLAASLPPAMGGPDGSIEVALRSGPRILVRPDEHVGRTIFFFGDLAPPLSWVCSRLLRAGDTVVDVGANYGVVTLLTAYLVGSGGTVHAVEPQPLVAALLRRSVALNEMTQVSVHELALSSHDGRLDLHVPDDNLGAASLSRDLSGPGSTQSVPVRQSGGFLDELGLGRVNLLKIDIEGHEAEFLAGARDYLASTPPDVILMESNDQILTPDEPAPSLWVRPAIGQLCALDYEIVAIDRTVRNLFFAGLTRLRPGHDDDYGHCLDYVAIHRSRYDQLAPSLGVKDAPSRHHSAWRSARSGRSGNA